MLFRRKKNAVMYQYINFINLKNESEIFSLLFKPIHQCSAKYLSNKYYFIPFSLPLINSLGFIDNKHWEVQ